MIKNTIIGLLGRAGYQITSLKKMQAKQDWLRGYAIKTVLDIGASSGDAAIEFAALFGDAQIYSFEPLSDIYAQMLQNTAHLPKFKAFNVAISDKDGESVIHRSSYSLSSSLLPMADAHKQAYPYTAGQSQQTIQTQTLDNIAQTLSLQAPLLIKIDVQGFEKQVLDGGKNTIQQAKIVIIETSFVELYQGQALFEQVASQMRSLGFGYIGSYAQRNHPKDGRPLQQDAMFEKL